METQDGTGSDDPTARSVGGADADADAQDTFDPRPEGAGLDSDTEPAVAEPVDHSAAESAAGSVVQPGGGVEPGNEAGAGGGGDAAATVPTTSRIAVAARTESVASALRELATVGQRPLTEHPDAFARVHVGLQQALSEIDDA